jgi:hypothetical protein
MSTATKVRKPCQRRQHERSVKVVIPPLFCDGEQLTLIRITQDGEQAHCWVSPLASGWGLAYRVEKPGFEGDETYDVLLEIEGDSCTCPGHTYGGYCKHVDALRALHAQGKLPLPAVANALHDDACACEGCAVLREYEPAGHDHGLPF